MTPDVSIAIASPKMTRVAGHTTGPSQIENACNTIIAAMNISISPNTWAGVARFRMAGSGSRFIGTTRAANRYTTIPSPAASDVAMNAARTYTVLIPRPAAIPPATPARRTSWELRWKGHVKPLGSVVDVTL